MQPSQLIGIKDIQKIPGSENEGKANYLITYQNGEKSISVIEIEGSSLKLESLLDVTQFNFILSQNGNSSTNTNIISTDQPSTQSITTEVINEVADQLIDDLPPSKVQEEPEEEEYMEPKDLQGYTKKELLDFAGENGLKKTLYKSLKKNELIYKLVEELWDEDEARKLNEELNLIPKEQETPTEEEVEEALIDSAEEIEEEKIGDEWTDEELEQEEKNKPEVIVVEDEGDDDWGDDDEDDDWD